MPAPSQGAVNTEVDLILARLSQEFVETASDQLDEIEERLDVLDSGQEMATNDLFDIQRNIHNIKGQGSTFGFPVIGRIAHLLEDYLENAGGVQRENIKDMRVFIDAMMGILSTGEHFQPHEVERLLRELPMGRPLAYSNQDVRGVDVLLVMPAGVQRKIVSQELLACGFQVNRAYSSLEALSTALDMVPDVVVINHDMTPFNGCELAKVFACIDKLKDTHIVLFTSHDRGDEHLMGLPENVSVVEKRANYAASLGKLLLKWGVFGDIAS